VFIYNFANLYLFAIFFFIVPRLLLHVIYELLIIHLVPLIISYIFLNLLILFFLLF
jgi:hypothetical protein